MISRLDLLSLATNQHIGAYDAQAIDCNCDGNGSKGEYDPNPHTSFDQISIDIARFGRDDEEIDFGPICEKEGSFISAGRVRFAVG